MRILLLCFILLTCGCRNVGVNYTEAITKRNTDMELLFAAGDMQGVADVYDPAGHMYSGYIHVQGSEQIEAYWKEISDPISWKLDVIAVSSDFDDVTQHPEYVALEKKPTHWSEKGIQFEEGQYMYEFGRSTLTRLWKGEESTSVVLFLLVWRLNDDGVWRIFIDTYV